MSINTLRTNSVSDRLQGVYDLGAVPKRSAFLGFQLFVRVDFLGDIFWIGVEIQDFVTVIASAVAFADVRFGTISTNIVSGGCVVSVIAISGIELVVVIHGRYTGIGSGLAIAIRGGSGSSDSGSDIGFC